MQGCDSVKAANVNIPDRSQNPPSAAVRLTRSQLAKKSEVETEEEPMSSGEGIDPEAEERHGYFVSDNGNNPTVEMSEPAEVSDTAGATVLDAPVSPLPTAVPNVIKSLRSDTPAKRSTSNKENVQPESDNNGMATPRSQSSVYDALEDAVVAAATPPRSEEVQASPKPEDPIAALDELEDAVETVNRDIPEVQDSPVKKSKALSPKRSESQPVPATEEAPKAEEKKTEAKKDSKKPAPVVRTTKAAQARISMAQNKDAATTKAPSLGRPRPSATLGRSNSVRRSVAPKSEATATAASKRVPSNPNPSTLKTSTSTAAATQPPREKKEPSIPHSKTRPISLSFPTPPPPPKSTKATTSSTFQLPGEAVAAKLKAAREARMAREAEDAEAKKKAGFKARPAPKAGGVVPSVRQTNASRARESVVGGGAKSGPVVGGHKRANTVGGGSTTTERPRTVSKESAAAATTKPAPPSAGAAARPRPSTSLTSAKIRPSLAPSTTTTTTTTTKPTTTAPCVPSNNTGTAGTAKGKEVFARTANAKLAAEKSKAEKEAAAKKARAEAAERGRVKSREWAERQRVRKLKAEGKEEVGEGGVESAPGVGGQPVGDEAAAAVVEPTEAAAEQTEVAAA